MQYNERRAKRLKTNIVQPAGLSLFPKFTKNERKIIKLTSLGLGYIHSDFGRFCLRCKSPNLLCSEV